MYRVINLVTGYICGSFSTYDAADNFRLTLDDFYMWDVEIFN